MNPKTSCFPALVLHSPNFSLSLSLSVLMAIFQLDLG